MQRPRGGATTAAREREATDRARGLSDTAARAPSPPAPGAGAAARSSGVFPRDNDPIALRLPRVRRIGSGHGPLVFSAGLCSMVCVSVSIRELLETSGASAPEACRAVAMFIAAFGVGARSFSRRFERGNEPLLAFAGLLLLFSLSSAFSLCLLPLSQHAYLLAGSASSELSTTLLRLVLCGLIIGLPGWLLGGTLPAITRAFEPAPESARTGTARALGWSAAGAAVGCAMLHAYLLERLGSRLSHLSACTAAALTSGAAYVLAHRASTQAQDADADSWPEQLDTTRAAREPTTMPAAAGFAYACLLGLALGVTAFVLGRALRPLVGQSLGAEGLVGVVALVGFGLGAAFYTSLHRTRAPSPLGLAIVCGLQAAWVAGNYAGADALAQWALASRGLESLGSAGLVYSWLQIVGLTVLPIAAFAGMQLPWFSALLCRGPWFIVRDFGHVLAGYACGSASGALAVGYGLFSVLSVAACWRAAATLFAVAGLALGLRYVTHSAKRRHGLWLVASAGSVAACLFAPGPSAIARHTPFSAAKVANASSTPEALARLVRERRHALLWEADGPEHTVALARSDGLTAIVDGEQTSGVRQDAATQIMAGLVAAALRPAIKQALVLGLGDGSTAGWLARLPEIELVEVVEPEPALRAFAQLSSIANLGALDNPRLKLLHVPARQQLSAANTTYDLIVSESPLTATTTRVPGATRELFELAHRRLGPEGLFVQRVRAASLATDTLQTVYATLHASFPYIETWQGRSDDLFLVAASKPLHHDAGALRARLSVEPFVAALRVAWHTEGLEGFLGHYVANQELAHVVARSAKHLSTDDKPGLESSFPTPHSATTDTAGSLLWHTAIARGDSRPHLEATQTVDWERVAFEREAFALLTRGAPTDALSVSPSFRHRLEVLRTWSQGEFPDALTLWNWLFTQEPLLVPRGIERLALAELIAYRGDHASLATIGRLLSAEPTAVLTLESVWLANHGALEQSAEHILQAIDRYRSDPWPLPAMMARSIRHLAALHSSDRVFAATYVRALSEPFAVYVNDSVREQTALQLATALGPADDMCVEWLSQSEPYTPWTLEALEFRAACYELHASPSRQRARRELDRFRSGSMPPFELLLR